MLEVEEDRHHRVAKEAGRHACQHQRAPEGQGERELIIAGDVRLLHRATARGDAPSDQRRGHPLALIRAWYGAIRPSIRCQRIWPPHRNRSAMRTSLT